MEFKLFTYDYYLKMIHKIVPRNFKVGIADYEDFDIPYGMVSKSYFVCWWTDSTGMMWYIGVYERDLWMKNS